MVTAAQLVLDFVNTLEHTPAETDRLASAAGFDAWLREQGLAEVAPAAGPAALRRARELREALRTLLAAHNDVDVDTGAAAAVLDRAARRAGLGLRFTADDVSAEPAAGGMDGVLGTVLAAVAETMAGDTWSRLKACRADDCRWAYLDTAKNRSRAWCSMSSCGNRAKVRAYRDRRASA